MQELWGEFAAAHPDLVKERGMSVDNLMHAITLVGGEGVGAVLCVGVVRGVCVCVGLSAFGGGQGEGHVC